MKIILRGTNNDYVNFENIFKIVREKPRSFDDDDKMYRIMAYLGVTSEYSYGEIELFKGTEAQMKNWDAWFCGEMVSIPPGTPVVILDPARLAYWGQDN